MKAIQMESRQVLKIALMVFLIASLSFPQTSRLIASDDGNGEDHAVFKVQKDVDDVTSSFTIEKSVDKTTLNLAPGQSDGVNYTIKVDSQNVISGSITVENKSKDSGIFVTEVLDVIEYHEGGPDPWKELKQVTVFSGNDLIDPKDLGSEDKNEKEYPYSISFKAPESSKPSQWRNIAYVTVSDAEGTEIGTLPSEPNHFRLPEQEEEVSISDYEEIGPNNGLVGFEVTEVKIGETSSADLAGPWNVEPPETITIHKTVTASASATPGTYTLHNVAAIVEGPSDFTDVTITVPSPPSSDGGGQSSGGGGEQSSSGGGSGSSGGGSDQVSASSTNAVQEPAPTFSPEQVVVAPAVVSQPSSSPQPVAQTQSTDLPTKLPFTGISLWYLLTAMTLILAGVSLQFLRYEPRHLRNVK
jgi:uncharacterized membrane protein YgcG